jgi:excisionase family DNA binding protein
MPIDYTTIEGAQELGISPITVRSLIHRKQLNAQRRGRDWFIAAEELMRYQRERHVRPGRPLSNTPSAAALAKRKNRATTPLLLYQRDRRIRAAYESIKLYTLAVSFGTLYALLRRCHDRSVSAGWCSSYFRLG